MATNVIPMYFFQNVFNMWEKIAEHWDNETKDLRNSICLLNKNYVYLASESPRGVNFHFHDSNLSGLQTPRNRN